MLNADREGTGKVFLGCSGTQFRDHYFKVPVYSAFYLMLATFHENIELVPGHEAKVA